MQAARTVHPGLREHVSRMTGYDLRLDPRAVHHGLPGPSATVIISFDEPLDVGWLGASSGRHWMLASGLHTRPALIRTHGVQHGIQLDLTPTGCRALLGIPMSGIARALADLADLPLGIPADLHARLAATTSWEGRFALLEGHLLGLLDRGDRRQAAPPADLVRGWAVLRRGHGRVRVAALADHLGWSRRHLVTRFAGEFGLAPSEVARLHRFGAALELGRAGRPWADVAVRAGYADQAHLSREFRALGGQTPTQWRTEVFPVVQDAPAAAAAGSTA
ncbi:helix-turn-helix domain-containing protein [Arsenicicoccus sp. oral taxon 190]|uniref:helix-turn-helix domain-containing protein n=1 Tax=Arsenicicoccus sp. oral taxon 190 TaxID=1658671 RepID=UPI000679F9F0|nr:AraC family transcriptional regulator [Arsenicicoccus sp. oral taxon 190]AKT50993.1 hypothetical protein ADJ73_06075 [Arsenicicoccus sp. oral taxon 190]